MSVILRGYQVNNPTWFYLSLLLILAVYFRFGRFWSLRNLDLVLMLSIAPALLYAQEFPFHGSLCLLGVTLGLLARTVCDSSFTRRPKLPQNMNPSGLAFLCAAAMAFLSTKALTETPPVNEIREAESARQMIKGLEGDGVAPGALPAPNQPSGGTRKQVVANGPARNPAKTEAGPGSKLIYAAVAATPAAEPRAATRDPAQLVAQILAILAHLAVVGGLIALGHYHMADLHLGLAMATLYILLPCTAYEVGRVNHVLPSALIVWAFVSYKRVLISGALFGLACGTLFFPMFLLPVWAAFYGRRGWLKFLLAVGGTTVAIVGTFWLLAGSAAFLAQADFGFFDWSALQFHDTESVGFWSVFPAAYRVPAFVSFLVMVIALTIWPWYKDLGQLMSSSAAIVIATQLWYPQQGSVYVLWYLPMLLMVVFRPPLHHHAAPDLNLTESIATPANSPPSSPISGIVTSRAAFL